jgi:hypothetical protein
MSPDIFETHAAAVGAESTVASAGAYDDAVSGLSPSGRRRFGTGRARRRTCCVDCVPSRHARRPPASRRVFSTPARMSGMRMGRRRSLAGSLVAIMLVCGAGWSCAALESWDRFSSSSAGPTVGPDAEPSLCDQLPDATSRTIGSGEAGDPVCNGDYGSDASAPCPTGTLGYCSNQGTCGRCGGGGANCAAAPGHTGPQCSPLGGECGAFCLSPADCPSNLVCDLLINKGACIPKYENGDDFFISPSEVDAGCVGLGLQYCASGIAVKRTTIECTCGQPSGSECGTNSDCASDLCAQDGRCGGLAGSPCDPKLASSVRSCRSGRCGSSCACMPGCSADSDCGSLLSGRVCSTIAQCVDGCRGSGGNTCPYGSTCTSSDPTIGQCIGDGGRG